MSLPRSFLLALFLPALLAPCSALVQTPLVVQAESGTRGSGFSVVTESSVTFLNSTVYAPWPGTAPGSTANVATYSVTFPEAGAYNLYARVRVGPGWSYSDGCFYAAAFGSLSATDAAVWTACDGLVGVGFTDPADPVLPWASAWGSGGAGVGVWKWVQLSGSNFSEAGTQFVVPAGGLTQTFQFGAKESSFAVDRFVFARDGVYFTVAQLEASTAGSTTAPVQYTPTHPPLATGKPKFLGCAYGPDSLPNFANYFNQVTPGNGGKWGSIESTRDTYNWTELDAAYRLAKANGFKFRYHVLVWGSQQPSWISSLTTAEKLEEIKEWFAAVATHQVDGELMNPDWIEVVNEPLHAPPNGENIAYSTTPAANYSDALGGAGTTGWDWILGAFRLARQYFPGKKLAINEYGVTSDATAMARYVGIINLLKAENLIDVVCFQGHSFSIKDSSTATISANLETLAATGLPIIVSEMDIDDTVAKPQLADYQRIFPLFWEHPSVIGVTLWGYRPGMWRSAANLVLTSGAEKPAMLWLKGYVRNNFPVVTAGQTFHVLPGSANGTILGPVQATDLDTGAVLQNWSIKDGTAASACAINATTGVLTLTNAAALNFGTTPSYTLRVKVGDGIGHSAPTVVTLLPGAVPAITGNPADRTVLAGVPAQFMASASGAPAPALRWERSIDGGANWTALADDAIYAGTGTATLTVAGTSSAMTGDSFRCRASNGFAPAAVSGAAVLTVQLSFDDWRVLNTVTGGATADPESCGVTNFARYAFNLPARGPVAVKTDLEVVTVGDGRHLQLHFTRQPAAGDVAYIVEWSSDLVTWTELDTLFSATPVDVFYVDAGVSLDDVPRRFLRVRATVR